MNQLITVVALISALFATSAATASTAYNYRYAFDDGSVVTGAFSGNASGNLITDLFDISAYLNGVAFNGNGHLYASGLDGSFNWSAGTGVASFNGLQNNFFFADSNFPLDYGYTNYFYDTYVISQDAFAQSAHGSAWDDLSSAPYTGANWSVTAAGVEVPEPNTLMLLGVACLGLVLRRHRSKRGSAICTST